MEYQKQTISLACAGDRIVTTEAMVGVGTGLAYHLVPSQPDLYTLTHVPSGFAITELTMPTEPEIQAFLEKVADLDPNRWQIGLVALKRRYNTNMRERLELAHYDSLSPYEVFMYPEYADGSAEPDFNEDAVEDPQAASNIALATSIFFYHRHFQRVERVRLVRMDKRTGQHETLHVYTREELMPRDLFHFIGHLLTLALFWLEVEQGEGQFTLEVDGWLATVQLHGKHVCLWDFDQDGDWEVYGVVDLAAANEVVEQEDEQTRMERMRAYWAGQPHTNTFGDYGLPQILPGDFAYRRPVCEVSQAEVESLHSGGVEA